MFNVLECTPIAQFAIGLDHKVTYWNRACELLTGCSAREMIGTDQQWKPFYPSKRPVLADFIIDDDFEEFQALYKNKGASESNIVPGAWEATDFFQSLGSRSRHIFFLAAPVRDPDGRMIGAVETLQDITRRVKAEKQLRESEKRYRSLTENVADGIVLFQDGNLIFSNQALAGILGYNDSGDFSGQAVFELMPDDITRHIMDLKDSPDREEPIERRVQFSRARADGTEIWVEARNSVIMWEGNPAVLTTIRDITETRVQEIAIRQEAEDLRRENRRLRSSMRGHHQFAGIVGKSAAMQEAYDLILKAAATDNNIIIYGESGTGKELVAKEIHNLSERREGEFVPVNSGAIPESLIEREFFGHKKGAFTGATLDTHGYLDLADGGVLFLDEVGDLSLNMQVKLLRAIEDGGYTPVGSNKVKKSDFRIIAATNKDLKEMVHNGQIRQDFFYRLHVIPITLPPLRERQEDISLLVSHFLKTLSEGEVSTLPDHIMRAFCDYSWPGNVRELQNMLRRYLTVGSLEFIGLDADGVDAAGVKSEEALTLERVDLFSAMENFEKSQILKALEKTRWHKKKAAARLGISRRTLFRKLKHYHFT